MSPIHTPVHRYTLNKPPHLYTQLHPVFTVMFLMFLRVQAWSVCATIILAFICLQEK